MGQILVRNLPDEVKEGLRRRAERHHRSVEAEAREILSAAVTVDPVLAWLDDSDELRRQFGGVDLPVPERTASRSVGPL
jgi:plasmid stability protein